MATVDGMVDAGSAPMFNQPEGVATLPQLAEVAAGSGAGRSSRTRKPDLGVPASGNGGCSRSINPPQTLQTSGPRVRFSDRRGGNDGGGAASGDGGSSGGNGTATRVW